MANTAHPDPNRLLTVGEVARRAGVPVSTIHFYERKGLIISTRNPGNQRRFAPVVLRYIAIIKVAQRTGIPALSSHWRKDLDARMTRLQRLRDELDTCIGCGCLSLTKCPLYNPRDTLGREGPGARILERE